MGNCASSKGVHSTFRDGGRRSTTGSKHKSPPECRSNRPAHIYTSTEQKKVAPEVNRSSQPTPLPIKAVEDIRRVASFGNLSVFTYDELRVATRSFRPDWIVGEGGFGVVYRGVIDENVRPGLKRTRVAVKVLNPNGFQGDREWLAEVSYLGQYSHPNLVKLIGYCCEDEHRLLVYEYMAQGCLDKLLFRRGSSVGMPWSFRIKIALDAAKGLACLHCAERPIIYRDFKTSNILLDEEYNAKLSDFGLAKEGPMGDQTHVTTRVMGTYGYAAPEYVMTGHLTTRSDVYGYGVVMLELLIGRRVVQRSRSGREHNLVDWARPLLVRNRKLLQIVDPRMEGQYTAKTIRKVAKLAYQCLTQNPKGRPIMAQVVEILQTIRTLPECQGQDAFFLRRSNDVGGVVTLYDAATQFKPAETGANEEKSDAASESEAKKQRRRRRTTSSSSIGDRCRRELFSDNPPEGVDLTQIQGESITKDATTY